MMAAKYRPGRSDMPLILIVVVHSVYAQLAPGLVQRIGVLSYLFSVSPRAPKWGESVDGVARIQSWFGESRPICALLILPGVFCQ
jgi:hypothetical protein